MIINKSIIIYNPVAGKGLAKRKLPHITSYLDSRNYSYELFETTKAGDAAKIAEEYASKEGIAIVAAGGDGTSNEVINGLMQGKGNNTPVLGLLPVGRGNDFSYGGQIPNDLDESLEILVNGNTSTIDVGLIVGGDYPNGRYFGNGIGIGFDTKVGLEAAKMPVSGVFGYILGTLKTLIKFPASPHVEISYSGKTLSLNAIQISIMNGQRMGGLFYMAPEAINNDGEFDICSVEHLSRRSILGVIKHYLKGTQKGVKGVHMDRGATFKIVAENRGLVIHADGETICKDGREVEVTCIPSPIRIIHK